MLCGPATCKASGPFWAGGPLWVRRKGKASVGLSSLSTKEFLEAQVGLGILSQGRGLGGEGLVALVSPPACAPLAVVLVALAGRSCQSLSLEEPSTW